MTEEKAKRTCFVVTPIGKPDTQIRRDADGIIEAVIKPALGTGFHVEAAHNQNEIGTITDQTIGSIFMSDLVIANLTGRNPNVMYELALRYAFGKPAVLIADEATLLPFDVQPERTIHYKPDALGLIELKEKLADCVSKINFDDKEPKSPIHKALKNEIGLKFAFEELDRESSDESSILKILLSKVISLEETVASRDTESVSASAIAEFLSRDYAGWFNNTLNNNTNFEVFDTQLEILQAQQRAAKAIKEFEGKNAKQKKEMLLLQKEVEHLEAEYEAKMLQLQKLAQNAARD